MLLFFACRVHVSFISLLLTCLSCTISCCACCADKRACCSCLSVTNLPINDKIARISDPTYVSACHASLLCVSCACQLHLSSSDLSLLHDFVLCVLRR